MKSELTPNHIRCVDLHNVALDRSTRRALIEREMLAKLLGQLGLIGNNLNQSAREMNLSRTAHVEHQEARDGDEQVVSATNGHRLTSLLRPRMLWAIAILTPVLTGCAVLAQGAARNPNALWVVVHDVCVPDQQVFANPAPCAEVDLAAGYVILEDPNTTAPTHFLLVPTTRVTGIEDPAILSPSALNYWALAWRARWYVDQRAGRPLGRDELSLAINSVYGRSQDQLHVHIDCIKPAVKAALHAHANAIGLNWSLFPILLAGEWYLARLVGGSDLDGVNPFHLLATLPEAYAAIGELSLVVTGTTGAGGGPGFILLVGRSTPGFGNRWGEALQDHHCALAQSSERGLAAQQRLPLRLDLAN